MATAPAPWPQRSVTQQERTVITRAATEASLTGKLDRGLLRNVLNVFLSDVDENSYFFADQMAALEGSGVLCPAVELEGDRLAPLNLIQRPQGPQLLLTVPKSQLMPLLHTAISTASQAGLRLTNLTGAAARNAFSALLGEFLIQRIESSRGKFAPTTGGAGAANHPGSVALPGLTLTVNTHTPNFQILYSPAYFVSLQTAFGNTLSTPVIGLINPGLYIFGAVGNGKPLVFENTTYSIPTIKVVNMTTV
jgi:hypothetical protein